MWVLIHCLLVSRAGLGADGIWLSHKWLNICNTEHHSYFHYDTFTNVYLGVIFPPTPRQSTDIISSGETALVFWIPCSKTRTVSVICSHLCPLTGFPFRVAESRSNFVLSLLSLLVYRVLPTYISPFPAVSQSLLCQNSQISAFLLLKLLAWSYFSAIAVFWCSSLHCFSYFSVVLCPFWILITE